MAMTTINNTTMFIDIESNTNYPMNVDPSQNPQDSVQDQSIKDERVIAEATTMETPDITFGIDADTNIPNIDFNEVPDAEDTKDGITLNQLPLLKIRNRRIRCNECVRYTAVTEEQMLRHVRRVHRGENPFQCCMCEYSTYNSAVFQEHVRVHRGIKPYKCSFCPYRSASKKNTKKHEYVHRPNNPNRCGDCGFIARHPKGLENHRKQVHAGNNENNPGLQCEHCDRTFETFERLTKHMRKCYQCNKKLCTRTYKKHLLEHSTVKGKKKDLFNCALCEWSGSQIPKILLHLIHHPKQIVDEAVINVSVLRDCGIEVGADAE